MHSVLRELKITQEKDKEGDLTHSYDKNPYINRKFEL